MGWSSAGCTTADVRSVRSGRARLGRSLLVLAASSAGLALGSAGSPREAPAMDVRGGADGIEACCLPDGSCVDLPAGSPVCIEFFGGVPQGRGTWCFTTACDGACCFPASGDCFEGLGFTECDAIGGVFAGFGSDCEPEPCGLPAGACCLPGGACLGGVPENLCQLTFGGSWRGPGTSCRSSTCCPGDLDGDGAVGFDDLLLVLAAWGDCSPAVPCPADLDGDGIVGIEDLLLVLANAGCG